MRPVATISRDILRRFDPHSTELSRSVNQALGALLYVVDNGNPSVATRLLETPDVLDFLRKNLGVGLSPVEFRKELLSAVRAAPIPSAQMSMVLDELPTLGASEIARLYFLVFLAARE